MMTSLNSVFERLEQRIDQRIKRVYGRLIQEVSTTLNNTLEVIMNNEQFLDKLIKQDIFREKTMHLKSTEKPALLKTASKDSTITSYTDKIIEQASNFIQMKNDFITDNFKSINVEPTSVSIDENSMKDDSATLYSMNKKDNNNDPLHEKQTATEYFGDVLDNNILMKPSNEDGKRFQCSYCWKGFTTKQNMQTHIRIIHNKIKQYTCEECNFEFGQKGDLDRHLVRKHTKKQTNTEKLKT